MPLAGATDYLIDVAFIRVHLSLVTRPAGQSRQHGRGSESHYQSLAVGMNVKGVRALFKNDKVV